MRLSLSLKHYLLLLFLPRLSNLKREEWEDHFSAEALKHQLDVIHLRCPALFLLGATCVSSILKLCALSEAEHFEIQLPACYNVLYQHKFQILIITVCTSRGAVLRLFCCCASVCHSICLRSHEMIRVSPLHVNVPLLALTLHSEMSAGLGFPNRSTTVMTWQLIPPAGHNYCISSPCVSSVSRSCLLNHQILTSS